MNLQPWECKFFNSGSLIHHDFGKLERARFSLSVNYIAVDEDGVCETGDRYQVIEDAHKHLAAPYKSRFGNCDGDQAFPYSVKLTGLGPLSDSLLCRESLDSPLVRLEKKK